jgi:hypothetical protein
VRPGRGYSSGGRTASELPPPPPSLMEPGQPGRALRSDATSLLAAIAAALNACERSGLLVSLTEGAVTTRCGYVLAVGDPRLGSRWAPRMRIEFDPDGDGPGRRTEITEGEA